MNNLHDYSTLFNFNPIPVWVYDLETFEFLDVNQAAADHYGYSREEFLSMTINDIQQKEDIPRVLEAHARIQGKEGNIKFGVFNHLKRNGTRLWAEINGHSVQFQGKRSAIVSCFDVTERKREEQKLKLFESVITHTNDAVLITEAEPVNDPGPRILYVNEAFSRMTGFTPEEVIGKSPRILQGPKSDKSELAKLGLALRNWESCEITLINYKKNGDEFWVNLSISPVADENGWFTHWIAVQKDVTVQKNEQIQKDLLANVSVIFNEASDLFLSLDQLCRLLVEFGEFSFCEVWLPNVQSDSLRLVSKFHTDEASGVFYINSSGLSEVLLDQGLPGAVWNRGQPILLDEVGQNESFLRRNAAKEAGIKAVMGIPLIHQDKVVGVLVIGTRETIKKIKQYGQVLSRLESFVGSEIHRKRLEGDFIQLFKALPNLICLADFNGKFLKINQAGCDLLEYSEEELIGSPFEKFVHPADKDISTREVQKLNGGATVFKFENRYITKSGKTIWLSWHCNSMVNEGVIYATAKNITEEKKLRELVDDASTLSRIGGWEIDLVNDKLIWSTGVHQIHETDPDFYFPELEEGIKFYRADFRDLVNQNVKNSIENGNSFDFEAALISAKGNEVWVRVIGQAEMINGKCVRVFGSFQDITSIKSTEIRLQAITNDLPGVAFRYFIFPDGSDKMDSVSQASLLLWGLSPEECESENFRVWDQIKAGGDYEKLIGEIQNSIQTLSQWHGQWRNILPNGELRWHEGYGTPYRLPDNTILFNSMIFDITDEKKTGSLYNEASLLAKIGSWELDLKNQNGTDTMYWSPMVREILEVDEIYNPSLTGGFEFYERSSREKIKEAVKDLIQTGKEFDLELLLFTATKKEKWIRCIGKCESANGKTSKIFGSFQDIHGMKSTQLKIEEILGSISDAFYAVDKEWNITYFNKEAENLLRKKNEDVIGKNFWTEFSPAFGTSLEEIYRKVADSGQAESFEYYYPGDNCWYEINAYYSNGGISSYFKNIDDKRKAAEALEKAYWEKINIIESIGDAFFTMKKDFTVTYWNHTAENLLGIKREQLVGKILWDLFPDAVNLPSYSNYKNVIETGQSITFEDYYGVWLEVNAYPSDEGITVFFRDITLRKDADERLKKAFEDKNKILESIGDAFFAVDQQWIVTYWNKEAEKVLGKSREEITGKYLWDVYADAIDSDFHRQYYKAVETGETVSFEEFYSTINKWFEVSAYPSPEGLSVYFKDITLRKEADIQIIQANERFEKVTQATTDAIWDWDLENDLFFRGNGFEDLFGTIVKRNFKESEFWQDNFHPEDLPEIQKSLEKSLKDPTCEYWQLEYRILHSSGEEKTVIDKGMIIRNEVGKATRMVGAITDISDRKKHEQELHFLNEILKKHIDQLEITNEQLEQFAFIASHDLQEPLRMISSFLNLLLKKYENHLDEKALQYIEFATDGAKRMQQLILDLLEYSRAGKYSESQERINLNEIVKEYTFLRKKVIEEKSVKLIISKLPEVRCFKAPLIQTIHSLLDNAIKYSKDQVSPIVTFSVTENEKEWIFNIKDNGIGIDSQFFEKIFIIFQRLHNRDQFGGTGIGLSIAKKQVESWGGKIWLESELGIGSSFYFTLKK